MSKCFTVYCIDVSLRPLLAVAMIWVGVVFAPTAAVAQSAIPAYEKQDVSKILVVTENGDGNQSYSLDTELITEILQNLKPHAMNYPTRFANEQDKENAKTNVGQLTRVLERMTQDDNADSGLMYQSAVAHNIAHNMGLKGASAKADRCYEILLKRSPEDKQVNYMFGAFLASSNRTKKAIPYLQKADELEFDSAAYTLGMAYAVLGEKDFALDYLNRYAERHPENERLKSVISAVESGKISRDSRGSNTRDSNSDGSSSRGSNSGGSSSRGSNKK